MKKRKVFFFLWLLVAMTGCASQGKELENNLNQIRIAYGEDGTSIRSFASRAKELKKALKAIEGVEDANVVITGHTALIGLVMNEEDNEEKSRAKQEAAKIAKQIDSGIYHTAITANQEIIDMIGEMEKERDS